MPARRSGACIRLSIQAGVPEPSLPRSIPTFDAARGVSPPARKRPRASFLLESVDQGRLGRHSFVGCGTRLVSFAEAEAIDAPVVGYLGYDHVATLEPTVTLPATARPTCPRAGSSSPTSSSSSTTSPAPPTSSTATATRSPRRLHARSRSPRRRRSPGETIRTPDQAEHERRVRRAQELIRRGDAFQIVLSQRAERPTTASPLAVYRALRRINPSPYLFLLELGEPRARRLVARDSRQGRGTPGEPESDRRHHGTWAG